MENKNFKPIAVQESRELFKALNYYEKDDQIDLIEETNSEEIQTPLPEASQMAPLEPPSVP